MSHRTRLLVLAGVVLGMIPAALDSTVVDTALPRMLSELGGVALWSWVVTMYLLASTVVVPVAGRLSDIHGRKRLFMGAAGVFVGASALCGLATSMPELIGFRIIQGLAGGALFPLGSTLIGDLFPPTERARLQGLYVGAFALATLVGPAVGGLLVDGLGWRSIFFLNLPLGLAALAVIGRALREEPMSASGGLDLPGTATLVAGSSLLLVAIAQGGSAWDWTSAPSLVLFVAAALLLLAFAAVEVRVQDPLLDPELFGARLVPAMSALGFVLGAALVGIGLFIPWFLQGVTGTGAATSGGALTPMMLGIMVSAVAGSQLARRFTYRTAATTGLIILAGGFLLLFDLSPKSPPALAAVAAVVAGVGAGLVMPLLSLSVQSALPRERRGAATGTVQFFRSLGSAIGSAAFLGVFTASMRAGAPAALAPVLSQLPPATASVVESTAASHPVDLMRLLLAGGDATLPGPGAAPVAGAIRRVVASSIHDAYALGLAVCGVGVVIALLLGRARLATGRAAADDASRLELAA